MGGAERRRLDPSNAVETCAMDEHGTDERLWPGGELPLDASPVPLRVVEGGAVRVGKARVSLDLVVEEYDNGMTPEDMVRAYDTLELADVYAVIAYYLRHRDQVRAYMKRREERAEALRAKIESERPPITREELLARRKAREKADAPAGQ
jgi:uncharacterized protein (DUF433 family)